MDKSDVCELCNKRPATHTYFLSEGGIRQCDECAEGASVSQESLREQILKAAALPAPHEHTSMIVYAGHAAENARLLPLLEKLADVAEAAERWINGEPGSVSEVDWDVLKEALARLKGVLK